MPNVAGIKFTKDAKNENRYVTVDLKKHGNSFNPLLIQIGALDSDAFEKKWAVGLRGSQVKKRIKKTIANHFKNK
jgi:hypothetical protein